VAIVWAVLLNLKHWRAAIVAGASISILAAAPADAQITYDPDSSAGKQYQLPVETARRQAGAESSTGSQPAGRGPGAPAGRGPGAPSSGGAGGAETSSDATLFGQGVRAQSAAAAKRASSGDSTSSLAAAAPDQASPRVAARTERAALKSPDGPGSDWWLYAAAAVLGCGLLTFLLRRSSAGSGPPPATQA